MHMYIACVLHSADRFWRLRFVVSRSGRAAARTWGQCSGGGNAPYHPGAGLGLHRAAVQRAHACRGCAHRQPAELLLPDICPHHGAAPLRASAEDILWWSEMLAGQDCVLSSWLSIMDWMSGSVPDYGCRDIKGSVTGCHVITDCYGILSYLLLTG